jgi:hypothetical protein
VLRSDLNKSTKVLSGALKISPQHTQLAAIAEGREVPRVELQDFFVVPERALAVDRFITEVTATAVSRDTARILGDSLVEVDKGASLVTGLGA